MLACSPTGLRSDLQPCEDSDMTLPIPAETPDPNIDDATVPPPVIDPTEVPPVPVSPPEGDPAPDNPERKL